MYLTCCRVLGVKPGSDKETIKAAFRRRAKEYHPDINNSDLAPQYFIIIKNAYQYLMENEYHPVYSKTYSRRRYSRSSPNHADLQNNRMNRSSRNHERPQSNYRRPFRYKKAVTLREILKSSLKARVIYIFFHFFFIFIGLVLIYRSVYDVFFIPVSERANIISAYFSLSIGLFFGLIFTAIFGLSAISYFRGR